VEWWASFKTRHRWALLLRVFIAMTKPQDSDLYFGHDRLPTIPLDRLDVLAGSVGTPHLRRCRAQAGRPGLRLRGRQASLLKVGEPGGGAGARLRDNRWR
jgi:hypothetical protein